MSWQFGADVESLRTSMASDLENMALYFRWTPALRAPQGPVCTESLATSNNPGCRSAVPHLRSASLSFCWAFSLLLIPDSLLLLRTSSFSLHITIRSPDAMAPVPEASRQMPPNANGSERQRILKNTLASWESWKGCRLCMEYHDRHTRSPTSDMILH